MICSKNFDDFNPSFSRKKKKILKKGLSFLPHLFTFGNAFFGFCSIILSARGDLLAAANFILLAALMDALDGRIARLVGAESDIGVQLDSLSDSISFCLAPALLAYCWQLKYLGFLGVIVSAIFLLTGLFRLARFNVMHIQQSLFFLGLPTTVAGCFFAIVLLNFFDLEKNAWFLFIIAFLLLLLSFLMISSVRFPTFKKKLFNLSRHWYVVAFVFLFAIISVMQFREVLLLLFLLYFAITFVAAIKYKGDFCEE